MRPLTETVRTAPFSTNRRTLMLSRLTAATALLVLSAGIAFAQTSTRVASFQDWSVYSYSGPDARRCYAASQPTQSQTDPAGRARDPAFFMVANWPQQAIDNEASIKMGYPLEANSTVTVTIDNEDVFNFFIGGDQAWIAQIELEDDLIDAMRAGVSMVVRGRSTSGTATTDTYSLRGITAALERVASECRQ